MKTLGLIAVSILACGQIFAADGDAKADVKAAAKKLGDKGNYSWTSLAKFEGGPGNFRPGPTEGKTDGGTVYLKMSFGDRNPEAVIKGGKIAIKGEDTWESADELEGNRAFMARRLQTFKTPVQEAQDLAEKSKSLKKDDDAITGDLSEDAVKDLLTFFRRPNADNNRPGPKDAKGSVKFWLKDGALTKYEYNVQGKITGRDDQEFNINRTTTVDIKDVGTTKVTVPDDAKKKLG